MQWWGWTLIAVAAVALGYVKMKVFSRITGRKNKPVFKDED